MAAPEPAARAANLFSIDPTVPFLDTLARALLDGTLPGATAPPPDPTALGRVTVLLPTRRAVRGLREAFLRVAPDQAVLLPRIRAIGDPDEIADLVQQDGAGLLRDAETGELPPAIRPMERRLALARLVQAWRRNLLIEALGPGAELRDQAAQALALADELAAFLDVVDAEQVELKGLAELVPAEFAAHWQRTLDFLAILTEHWPAHLAERGRLSPIARRNALLAAEAARLSSSAEPIVAAGSTGTAPATMALLATIARLPNGAVVLPGLDVALEPEAWDAVRLHPEHPQFGLSRLIEHLGVARDEVKRLPAEPNAAAALRTNLIADAMRPASAPTPKPSKASRKQMSAALAPITLLAAASAEEEAEAIALVLRHAIETPDKTAALITPDRDLARRVSARLLRWDLVVDDSAGKPVAETVPGAFLQLVVDAVAQDFAPSALMALLKHPLTRLGWSGGECRAHARALELLAFRGQYAIRGLKAIRAQVEHPGNDPHAHPARRRLGERDLAAARMLLQRIEHAYAPLLALAGSPAGLAAWAEAHAATAEALARDETGSGAGLWRGEAGEALALFLAELLAEADGFALSLGAYPAAWRALVGGLAVRPRAPAHPRLSILGTLEARLQRADLVVLGGLNEGVWPRAAESGPWLSRPMRKALGLPSPERLIGLAAHDFTQALGAPEVFLTRAAKVDGVQTVPSRWLQRLKVLRQGLGLAAEDDAAVRWLAWARARDTAVAIAAKPLPPAPCPPVTARPSRLSVSDIERWMANPYEIYARKILRLDTMPPLARPPDAALRGNLVHAALHAFGQRHPTALPDDPAETLIRIGEELFAEIGDEAAVAAFWRPQFARFARWFAETEPERRHGVEQVLTEVEGRLRLDTERGFTLTARADRIDRLSDRSFAIYDYKTGAPPKLAEVVSRKRPQLLLEAAIALGGGFADHTPADVARLAYIQASGGRIEGKEEEVGQGEARQRAEEALALLTLLARSYEDAATPYPALRRPIFERVYAYDRFAHLARVAEWSAEEPAE